MRHFKQTPRALQCLRWKDFKACCLSNYQEAFVCQWWWGGRGGCDHYYDYDDETSPRFDFQYLWARSGEEVRSLSSGSCPLSGTPSHAVDLGSTSPFLPFFTSAPILLLLLLLHPPTPPLWKLKTLLTLLTRTSTRKSFQHKPMFQVLKDTSSFGNTAKKHVHGLLIKRRSFVQENKVFCFNTRWSCYVNFLQRNERAKIPKYIVKCMFVIFCDHSLMKLLDLHCSTKFWCVWYSFQPH